MLELKMVIMIDYKLTIIELVGPLACFMRIQETLLRRQSSEPKGDFTIRGYQTAGLTIIIAISNRRYVHAV